jgi:hypothetical protein
MDSDSEGSLAFRKVLGFIEEFFEAVTAVGPVVGDDDDGLERDDAFTLR